MFNEKDYEVRVQFEGGIIDTALSESDALKRVRKIFREEATSQMGIDMEFLAKKFPL